NRPRGFAVERQGDPGLRRGRCESAAVPSRTAQSACAGSLSDGVDRATLRRGRHRTRRRRFEVGNRDQACAGLVSAMRAAGHATRERILAAAKDEFTEYGFAGARLNRIASTARASKERLYSYFASKEQLFEAVVAQWIEDAPYR